MIKHGTSHSMAYLVSTVVAGLLVSLLRNFVPAAMEKLNGVSDKIIGSLHASFITQENMNILLLAIILAFIWGVAFKHNHTD
jgi:hypothetical protein